MACVNTLTEILRGCDNNAGGLTKFYVAPADSVTAYTESNGVITAISMSAGTSFVEFEFNRGTSNYTEEATVNIQNGSVFYNQTISLQLARRESAKRQALLLIASGIPDLTVIVLDGNGLYFGFGFGTDKVNLGSNGGGSGTAKADLNGYSITLTSESSIPAFEVTSGIVAAII